MNFGNIYGSGYGIRVQGSKKISDQSTERIGVRDNFENMVRNTECIRIDIENRVRNTERNRVTSIYMYGYGMCIGIGTSEYGRYCTEHCAYSDQRHHFFRLKRVFPQFVCLLCLVPFFANAVFFLRALFLIFKRGGGVCG